MKLNKWTMGLAAILLAGVISSNAQPLAVTTTNPPTIQQGAQEIVNALESGTNWWAEVHGLYAPSLAQKYGGGAGVFWNLSDLVYAGTRVDWVDGGFWMPSLDATFQVPLQITSWLRVAPFGVTGVGIPLSGAKVGDFTIPGSVKDNNGQPTAILGYGMAVHVAKINTTKKYLPKSVDLLGDTEKWTGFEGNQYRVALAGHWTF